MDAQFERRLLFSINGQNSLSAYQTPLQSPIKSSDRYIPLRSSLSASNLHYPLNSPSPSASSISRRKFHSSSSSTSPSPNKKCKFELNPIGLSDGVTANQTDLLVYQQLLQNTLLDTKVDSLPLVSDSSTKKKLVEESDSTIFRYSERSTSLSNETHSTRSPISTASVHLLYSPKKTVRHIAEHPFKVLDAPDLQDDFYLNLIDWSASNNLSVGLNSCVYIYNAQSNQVQLLTDLCQTPLTSSSPYHPVNLIGSDVVTSVQWAESPNYLAVGQLTTR